MLNSTKASFFSVSLELNEYSHVQI